MNDSIEDQYRQLCSDMIEQLTVITESDMKSAKKAKTITALLTDWYRRKIEIEVELL